MLSSMLITLGILVATWDTGSDELTELRAQVDRLESDKAALDQKCEALQVALEASLKDAESWQSETKGLSDQLKQEQEFSERLQAHLDEFHKDLKQQLSAYDAVVRGRDEVIRDLHQELKAQRESEPILALEKTLKDQKREIQQLKIQNDVLRQSHKSLEKELDEAEQEGINLSREMEEILDSLMPVSDAFEDIPEDYLAQELEAESLTRRIVAIRMIGMGNRESTELLQQLWERTEELEEGEEFEEICCAFTFLGSTASGFLQSKLDWEKHQDQLKSLIRAIRWSATEQELPTSTRARIQGIRKKAEQALRDDLTKSGRTQSRRTQSRRTQIEDLLFEIELTLDD